MTALKGKEYKRFEDIKHIREDGSEYWSAKMPDSILDQFPEVRNLVKGGRESCYYQRAL